MNVARDPIFIHPRMLPRRWGRTELGAWCADAPRPKGPIGEIWLAHSNNQTSEGEHLGALISAEPETMLGDLGRAPPSMRLVLTSEPTDALYPEGPVSLWRILESPLDGTARVDGATRKQARQIRCRHGDLFRTTDRVGLAFGAEVVALETRAGFAPFNDVAADVTRLSAIETRKGRQTWLRDVAMSVEAWTLPAESRLVPDGETCHVLTALTPGAALDGRALAKGETVFLPANARPATLTGRAARILVAYPDLVPTAIWRTTPQPRPALAAVCEKNVPMSVEAISCSQLQTSVAA